MEVPRPAWHEKLQPIFFELAALNRECERALAWIHREKRRLWQLKGAEAERTAVAAEIERQTAAFDQFVEATLFKIQNRHPNVPVDPRAFSYLGGPAVVTPIGRLAHWFRHSEAVTSAIAARQGGDIPAHKRIGRTEEDIIRAVHQPQTLKPFKTDTVHRQLLELIIAYTIGPLSHQERAQCMDEFCACGNTHDIYAIKNQYKRLDRDLTEAYRANAVK